MVILYFSDLRLHKMGNIGMYLTALMKNFKSGLQIEPLC